MNEEIAVLPDSEVKNSESLEFLRELIGDGLQRNDTLFRAASAGVVDLLENSIRVGFYLSDAKSYLAGDGKFIKCVEHNFKISYARANQLHRLSKHFSRDLVDSQQRERLGITPKGLDAATPGTGIGCRGKGDRKKRNQRARRCVEPWRS
jgi:hypothetical protein